MSLRPPVIVAAAVLYTHLMLHIACRGALCFRLWHTHTHVRYVCMGRGSRVWLAGWLTGCWLGFVCLRAECSPLAHRRHDEMGENGREAEKRHSIAEG